MELLQLLRESEEALQRREVRSDPERLSKLLANEFREFGSSGRVFTKADIIPLLQVETFAHISSDHYQAQYLASEVALLTYRATNLMTQEQSLRSSIWIFRDGRWQMIFHQGTKRPPAALR